jgi:hypothetical protein
MEIMQTRQSQNECPWCGEKEWNCYYVNARDSEERGADELYPRGVVVTSKNNVPLVDLNHCPIMLFDAKLVDECAYCGAVVS